jgi:hypothetical protein
VEGSRPGVTLARENGALTVTLGAGLTRVALKASKTEIRQ